MTGKRIPADVEWAVRGKTLGRQGARVLACSTGSLSSNNFEELIERFSLGTSDTLPQVSVSYMTTGKGTGRRYYLGMAIHKWAADVQTDGGELLEGDDDNRPVTVTTYFCVPYPPLAKAAVSYQAMYGQLSSLRLGTASGPPLPVEFPVRDGLPAIDALVMQSASRLLTGRPVCVLGAETATLDQRLEFIDAVAALLPYGFRTKLTAATWVRPTHRDHRFQLFFSDAKRDTNPADGVVYWGHPEQTALTRDDDYVHRYNRWLASIVGPLERLGRLTTPRSFKNREEVLLALDEIGFQRPPNPSQVKPVQGTPAQDQSIPRKRDKTGTATMVLPRATRDVRLDGDQLLQDCADAMRMHSLDVLHTVIPRLRNWARSGIAPGERDRYQKFIKEQCLFRHDEALGTYEDKLRDALLRVAFTSPLTYPDYCLIEDSLGAGSPDPGLLRRIDDVGISGMRIKTVVYAQWPEDDVAERLSRWYTSGEITAHQMINDLAGAWHRPQHAFHASRMTARFMDKWPSESALVRAALQNHSYLGWLLQDVGEGHDDVQVDVLTTFLRRAYPKGLSERDVLDILAYSQEPPSKALHAAVLLRLIRPDELRLAGLAGHAFAARTALAMNLGEEKRGALEHRLEYARPYLPEGAGP